MLLDLFYLHICFSRKVVQDIIINHLLMLIVNIKMFNIYQTDIAELMVVLYSLITISLKERSVKHSQKK